MAYHAPKPPEPCKRCGQSNCDEVPEGLLQRMAELLSRLPVTEEDDDLGEELEPLI